MIASITGTILEREENAVIVDVHGIGYRVFVGEALASRAKVDENISLHIHHYIVDSNQSLYGFSDKRELEFFELLLTVPHVGASTARRVLNIAAPDVLEQAVLEEDMALLTKVSGVGKRMAERIIVELKEKIHTPKRKRSAPSGDVQHEALEALMSIGFTQAQARKAVSTLPKSIKTVEEAVKTVLQNIKA